MNECTNIEGILNSILEEYSRGEILAENLDNTRENYKQELYKIKEAYGLDKKTQKIKIYAGYSIKKNINDNIQCGRRYDYDLITNKDKEGELLNYIADYLISDGYFQKQLFSYGIITTIVNNIIDYYRDFFDEEIENCKNNNNNTQYGSFDYMES